MGFLYKNIVLLAIGGFAALCAALVFFAPAPRLAEEAQVAQVEAEFQPVPEAQLAPEDSAAPVAQMTEAPAAAALPSRAQGSVNMPSDLDESQRQELQARLEGIAMFEQQIQEVQANEELDESSFGIVAGLDDTQEFNE